MKEVFQKAKNFLKMVFGSYTPPEWLKKLVSIIKTSRKVRKGIKISLISLAAAAGLFILSIAGIFLYEFIQSKKPVEMTVSYSISRPEIASKPMDSMSINFYGSVAPLDSIDQPITSDITISPAIQGSWKWLNDDCILFTPSEPWNLGTEYSITFGKELFADHISIDKSNVSSFTTESFSLGIYSADFIIDDIDPKKKFITFELSSNFPIAEQDFSSLISIKPDMKNPKNGTVENRDYSFNVSFDDSKKIIYVTSEIIGVPADDINFDITVKNGIKSSIGNAASEQKLSAQVYIPGSNNYAKIRNINSDLLLNENQEYNQIVSIETTAKISIEELNSHLEFYQLPEDRPEEPGHKAVKNYYWDNTDFVTDKVINLSKKLEIKAYETENKYETVHNYYIDVPENCFIYASIKAGAHFYGDYYLSNDYQTIFTPRQYPKEINFVSEGSLISLNGSRKIPILTRGIPDVDVKIWRFKPDEINHIVSQSNGNLKNFRFNSSSFDEDNVGEFIYDSKIATNSTSPKSVSYINFNFSDYLAQIPSKDLRYGLFLIKLSNSDCNSVKKLVMVTDQAIIMKKTNKNGIDLFVQSISSGKPVSSSNVKVISLNGDVLAASSTDRNGHVFIPEIQKSENRPVAITAVTGNDFAFVPYDLNGRSVDYSNFDVGGLYGAQDPDKLSAYIFSDRGIYRPGDEMRFGLIVKAGDWSKDLDRTPLAYVITDPNGNEVCEKEFLLNQNGFEEIKYSTKGYSPTGIYNFYLYLKKKDPYRNEYERILIGSETAKVEEFMPDTLQISSSFEPLSSDGWIHPQNLTALVKLKNMFGSVAYGNAVKAEMELKPGYLRFNKYRDYRFNDPYIAKESFSERLNDTTTNEEGYARFDIDMERFAPASYRLIFTADGFEKESGRSVTTSSSLYVSPLDYLIGVKADGALDYINKGSKRMLKFIAVGPNLESIKVDDVKLSITENRYVSVLVKQPNGIYKYQSVKKEYPVLEKNNLNSKRRHGILSSC